MQRILETKMEKTSAAFSFTGRLAASLIGLSERGEGAVGCATTKPASLILSTAAFNPSLVCQPQMGSDKSPHITAIAPVFDVPVEAF